MNPRRFLHLLALLSALAACVPRGVQSPAPSAAGAFDVVIENGRIVDGTGAAWFYGDVGLRGDRIARVAPRGMLRAAAARQRIDARGLVVAPGFIDIQSGSYGSFLGNGDGRSVSKITQGITTEIMGEGGTPAPLNPATRQTGAFALGSRGADASVMEVARRYAEEAGHAPYVFAGSSPGAASFGHIVLRPV